MYIDFGDFAMYRMTITDVYLHWRLRRNGMGYARRLSARRYSYGLSKKCSNK